MENDSAPSENATPIKHAYNFKDLTGQTFGRLTVISLAPYYVSPSGKKFPTWTCSCSCGSHKMISVLSSNLKRGQSCGCLSREAVISRNSRNATHGHTRRGEKNSTSTYNSWRGTSDRCFNPSGKDFARYMGRGITVCARWLESFENFLSDMGECPAGMTIDRIDNNANYSCGKCDDCLAHGWLLNCRWATKREQQRNIRSNQLVTLSGETLCLSEWDERNGYPHGTVHKRLKAGWEPERAVSQPMRNKR